MRDVSDPSDSVWVSASVPGRGHCKPAAGFRKTDPQSASAQVSDPDMFPGGAAAAEEEGRKSAAVPAAAAGAADLAEEEAERLLPEVVPRAAQPAEAVEPVWAQHFPHGSSDNP